MSERNGARGRALILGAGSQIAGSLSQRLSVSGWHGQALSRNAPPTHAHLAPAFSWGRFDASECRKLPGAWDVVFSVVPLWLLPPLVPSVRGAKQIIAFSSTSVFAKAVSPDPAERELAERLAEAERAVANACRSARMNYTLLRPTLVYGSGRDRNVSRIADFIRRWGFFPVLNPARGLRQPVHAEDLALAAIACVGNPEARNASFDLPGGELLTFKEMVTRVFVSMGRRPVFFPVPQAVVNLSPALLGKLLPKGFSPAVLWRMNRDQCFSLDPAARALGYRPRAFQPEAGLKAELPKEPVRDKGPAGSEPPDP